jgi:hypothetical protein
VKNLFDCPLLSTRTQLWEECGFNFFNANSLINIFEDCKKSSFLFFSPLWQQFIFLERKDSLVFYCANSLINNIPVAVFSSNKESQKRSAP